MTQDNQQEERVRGAFAALADSTPIGAEFDELADAKLTRPKSTRFRGGLAFGTAFVAVVVLGVIGWWALETTGDGDADVATPTSAVTEPTFTPPLDDATAQSLLDYIPERPVLGPFSYTNPPTFEEYEEAVAWTVSCIESLGAPVHGFGPDSEVIGQAIPSPGIPASAVYVWGVGDPPPGSPAGSGAHASDFCRMFFENVFTYYYASPTQAEIDAWYDELRACMVDAEVQDIDGIFGTQITDDTPAELGVRTYWDLAAEKVPIHCWP